MSEVITPQVEQRIEQLVTAIKLNDAQFGIDMITELYRSAYFGGALQTIPETKAIIREEMQ